jgi:hypothetical protein
MPAKEALVSPRNVAITSEPVAVCAAETDGDLAQSLDTSPTSWIPRRAIPLTLGRRRVGSLESGDALSCQRAQDQDRGAAICYIADCPLDAALLRPLAIALTAAAGAGRSIDQLNDVHRLLDRA